MSKMTKTIAALGVVAGLGVAALPLASYAADTQNIGIQADLDQTISVSTPTAATIELDITNGAAPVSGSSSVNVTTNATNGYTLNIKATTNTYLATTAGDQIPAGEPTQNTSAWGYMGGDVDSYKAITTTDSALKTTDAENTTPDTVELTVGVTASSTQASGSYTGSVTLTAVAN